MDAHASKTQIEAYLKLYHGDVEAAMADLRQIASLKTRSSAPDTSNHPVIISLHEISKQYKRGRRSVQALQEVSADIRQGEFIAITGASGSGKSTLLQLIGGLDRPTTGDIIVNDTSLQKLSDRKLSHFRGQTIGFVFQFFYLQPFLTLQRNIELAGMFARTPKRNRRRQTDNLAKLLGLDERLQHYSKELSGGQIQRAAIARALLNKPKILLADEPTGNLDSKNSDTIITIFEKIRQQFGTTVIVATHDRNIANRADRELRLKDGALL